MRKAMLRWVGVGLSALWATALLWTVTAGQVSAQMSAQASTQAGASDQEARALFEAGRIAYDNGRYEDALTRFKRAYELSERAPLLYNIANSLDRLRRDEEALSYFEAFVDKAPNSPSVPAARERIKFLRGAIERRNAQQTAQPTPTPVPTPAEVAQASAGNNAQPSEPGAQAPAATTGASTSDGKPLTQQWWFWTGAGAVVLGAVIVGVAVAAFGGSDTTEGSLGLNNNTRDVSL